MRIYAVPIGHGLYVDTQATIRDADLGGNIVSVDDAEQSLQAKLTSYHQQLMDPVADPMIIELSVDPDKYRESIEDRIADLHKLIDLLPFLRAVKSIPPEHRRTIMAAYTRSHNLSPL